MRYPLPTITEMQLMKARGQLPRDILPPLVPPRSSRPAEIPSETFEDENGVWRGI